MKRPTRLTDAEFALVAACCHWPLSDAVTAAIRSATAPALNWSYFMRLVTRHRVAGLVHDALTAAKVELPPDVARQLAARSRLGA